MGKIYQKVKPFFGAIFLQFGFAGMDILSKVALNEGMSNYVFVVYRHAIATIVMAPFAIVLDKKTRPKLTPSIFIKIMLLSLLEPVIDQNLYFLGMKYTTATFATTMTNILPAITFIMACVLRMEKVKLNSIRSQAKIFGTAITVAGAMIMTLAKGPIIELFWTKGGNNHEPSTSKVDHQHVIKGSVMIIIGCFSWASFINLQAITLRTYPADLSLTAWICMLGTAEGAIVAFVMERGNLGVWSINWDTKLLTALYSGIVCSGFAYYIQGVVMKDRGPVFVTAFSPLCMVIVAVMSTIILAEQMFIGRVIGAICIVAGLYLVMWGKSKDYMSPSPVTAKLTETNMQIMDKCNEGNEISHHEVIIVNAFDKETTTVQHLSSLKGFHSNLRE
ncbi:hypothetical protein NMG60_11000410 [Bertholletia excelsa]